MLLFYDLLLILFIAGWVQTMRALMDASRAGRSAVVPALRWIAVGMALSAISYLFRILDYGNRSHMSILAFAFGAAGIVAIYASSLEYAKRVTVQRQPVRPPESEPAFYLRDLDPGLPRNTRIDCVTAEVREAFECAVDSAKTQGRSQVDTDDLLYGIVCLRSAMGTQILAATGSSPSSLRAALETRRRRPAESGKRTTAEPSIWTEKSKDAVVLAAIEAARFDAGAIGTHHLLLGLALNGAGAAAHILLGQGITVDALRNEIQRRKLAGRCPCD